MIISMIPNRVGSSRFINHWYLRFFIRLPLMEIPPTANRSEQTSKHHQLDVANFTAPKLKTGLSQMENRKRRATGQIMATTPLVTLCLVRDKPPSGQQGKGRSRRHLWSRKLLWDLVSGGISTVQSLLQMCGPTAWLNSLVCAVKSLKC